ncbi:hypothetical protein DA2_1166 [Desulfovibrio sp. A2]|nr:hypothetical protein DA2_1166 [Desulfovibrio sp. A2]
MFSPKKPGLPLAALLVAGLLLAPGTALGGKVYIWTDEKGVKHISDTPPAAAPADMKSLSATPNAGRADTPSDPSLGTPAGAPAVPGVTGPGEGGTHVVDGVVLGPDGQPVRIAPDGQPAAPGQPAMDSDGQLLPAIQAGPDPKVQEREALQRRLEELQKEKEAYDLANRRARSAGDGYAKQRSRYYQNEVEGRINEVQSRLKLLAPEGAEASGEGGGQ